MPLRSTASACLLYARVLPCAIKQTLERSRRRQRPANARLPATAYADFPACTCYFGHAGLRGALFVCGVCALVDDVHITCSVSHYACVYAGVCRADRRGEKGGGWVFLFRCGYSAFAYRWHHFVGCSPRTCERFCKVLLFCHSTCLRAFCKRGCGVARGGGCRADWVDGRGDRQWYVRLWYTTCQAGTFRILRWLDGWLLRGFLHLPPYATGMYRTAFGCSAYGYGSCNCACWFEPQGGRWRTVARAALFLPRTSNIKPARSHRYCFLPSPGSFFSRFAC